MQVANSFKLAFLRNMLVGLKLGGPSSTDMSFLERKRAIKLAADVAMASARGGARWWSRALIANLSKQEKSRALVRTILGKGFERLPKSPQHQHCPRKISSSKKILRRSLRGMRGRIGKCRPPPPQAARSLAKGMVKQRTRVLKRLVPGGESLDGFSLLDETLDYIVSLRAQVDLMQRLVNALGDLSGGC